MGLALDIFPELEKRFVTFLGIIKGNEMKEEETALGISIHNVEKLSSP